MPWRGRPSVRNTRVLRNNQANKGTHVGGSGSGGAGDGSGSGATGGGGGDGYDSGSSFADSNKLDSHTTFYLLLALLECVSRGNAVSRACVVLPSSVKRVFSENIN